MSTDRDFDRIAGAWLAEGPSELADRVLDAALDEIHQTHQRRALAIFTRAPMKAMTRQLVAMALVIGVLLIGGGAILAGVGRGPSSPVSPGPSPSDSTRVSPAPTPAVSPLAPFGYDGGGLIEFTRHNAEVGDSLYLIDPAGLNERLLLPDACCGLFSPDGSLLAAAVPGVGPANRGSTLLGIQVLDMPGATAAFTIPSDCTGCAIADLNIAPDTWSSDGAQVAVDLWSDADPAQSGLAIATKDFPPYPWGIPKSHFTGVHRDFPIAFSPDGSMLLYMREEQTSGPTSIGPMYLLTIADGTTRQVTPPGMTVSTNGLTQGPASWSPDGSSIAFAASDTSSGTAHTSIFTIAPAVGATVQTLVADAMGATSAHFSPDGSWVAFDRATRLGAAHDLFVVHPDGTGETNLSASFDPGVCCGLWSPDGKALLIAGTSSDDQHNDLFIVSLAGDVWQVTRSPGTYTGFQWGATAPAR